MQTLRYLQARCKLEDNGAVAILEKIQTELKSTKVSIKNLFFEELLQFVKDNRFYSEKPFRIYLASLGRGRKDVFIVTKGTKELALGDCELFLRLISEETFKLLCSHPDSIYKLTAHRDYKEMYENLEFQEIVQKIKANNNNTPFVFELTAPIPKAELQNIEDFHQFAMQVFSSGLQKDELINFPFCGQVLNVNNGLIEPREVAPFSSHMLIVTNSKTSKTSNADIVGPTIDNCSVAFLLGFGTSNTKQIGFLHGQTTAVSVDELQETQQEQVLGHLHSLLEKGSVVVGKGVGVRCDFWGSLNLLANPKRDSNEDLTGSELISEFITTLKKATTNIAPFSSRISFTIVSRDLKQVRGKPLSLAKQKRLRAVLYSIRFWLEDIYSKLLINSEVNDWLNEPHPKEHIDLLTKYSERTDIRELIQYLDGQKENFRHVRGFALSHAILKLGHQFLFYEVPTRVLLELATQFYDYIISEQRKIFEGLIGISLYEQETYLLSQFDNLEPLYSRVLVHALYLFLCDFACQLNDPKLIASEFKKAIVLTQLDPYLKIVPEAQESRYFTIKRLMEKATSSSRVTSSLNVQLNTFGYRLIRLRDTWVLKPIDLRAISNILHILYKNNKIKYDNITLLYNPTDSDSHLPQMPRAPSCLPDLLKNVLTYIRANGADRAHNFAPDAPDDPDVSEESLEDS